MSRTVDLFVDSDQPLDQVAALIGDLVGRPLVCAPDGRRYLFDDGEVVAHLSEHDFVDDEDLPLSEFRYVLSAVVRSVTTIDTSAEIALMRMLNAGLRERNLLPSLLVVDLERPDDEFAPQWRAGSFAPEPCHSEDDGPVPL